MINWDGQEPLLKFESNIIESRINHVIYPKECHVTDWESHDHSREASWRSIFILKNLFLEQYLKWRSWINQALLQLFMVSRFFELMTLLLKFWSSGSSSLKLHDLQVGRTSKVLKSWILTPSRSTRSRNQIVIIQKVLWTGPNWFWKPPDLKFCYGTFRWKNGTFWKFTVF